MASTDRVQKDSPGCCIEWRAVDIRLDRPGSFILENRSQVRDFIEVYKIARSIDKIIR